MLRRLQCSPPKYKCVTFIRSQLTFCSDDSLDDESAPVDIDAFRASLRSIRNEADKFEACLAMRNRLLDQHTELESLFSRAEKVMVEESRRYRENKCSWGKPNNNDADAKHWERFVSIAECNITKKRECLAPLAKASAYWGNDKVLYYEYAKNGWGFCKVLGTAVTRNSNWEESVVKMNQLLKRRVDQGGVLKTPSPVEQKDLEQLKHWVKKDDFDCGQGFKLKCRPLTDSDMPAGHGFDRYGLIVPIDSLQEQATKKAQTCATTTMSIVPSIHTSTGTQHLGNSSSSSPLSLLESTPATTPTHDSVVNSPQPESRAVSPPPRSSDRLRSCPAVSYASQQVPIHRPKSRSSNHSPKSKDSARPSKPATIPTCDCSSRVSSAFLSFIDRDLETNMPNGTEIAAQYGTEQQLLCDEHVRKYATWITTALLCSQSPSTNFGIPKRSLPEVPQSVSSKRSRRLSLPEVLPGSLPPTQNFNSGVRPTYDSDADASFRREVMAQLLQKAGKNQQIETWGDHNVKGMLSLLGRAREPCTEGDEVEIHLMTGTEAKDKLESRVALHGPIMTEHQQHFEWEQNSRPMEQLFRRMGNPNRTVAVQKPSLSLEQPSYVPMRLGDVQHAFKIADPSDDPFNVLDLRNPLPKSVLPPFLTGEDCQLLIRVRDTILEGATAQRCTARVSDWNKWREDEDWVLLAQGGALTLTHQDSCGKATWLTVQEGQVGFGWISRPSNRELQEWSASPYDFTGGQVRYVVLRPGQTIYFEAGTIHFVFRLEQSDTFMVGGHVLRWSRVSSWMATVLNQLKHPDTTNEELLPSLPAYVKALTQLVSEQQDLGNISELGGMDAINTFSNLKKQVDRFLAKRA